MNSFFDIKLFQVETDQVPQTNRVSNTCSTHF